MCAFLGTKMVIFRKCLELSKMVRNAKIIVLTQSLIVSHNDQILVSDSIPVSHSIQYEILLACLLIVQQKWLHQDLYNSVTSIWLGNFLDCLPFSYAPTFPKILDPSEPKLCYLYSTIWFVSIIQWALLASIQCE